MTSIHRAGLAALLLASCAASALAQDKPPAPATPAAPALAPATSADDGTTIPAAPHYGEWGFDAAGMDRAVAPGNGFFDYADGTAVREMVIPADRTAWGAFPILADLSQRQVHGLLDAASKPGADGSKLGPDMKRAAAFYAAFMDEKAVEARGIAPLAADFARVKAAATPAQIATLFGEGMTHFGTSLFGLSIDPDAKHPERYAIGISQPGLGLPDKSFYTGASFAAKKTAYRAYVEAILKATDWPDAAASADRILAFEEKLAAANWERKDRRDPDKTYNPVSFAELVKLAPGFDWSAYFAGAGLPKTAPIVLAEKSAIVSVAALVGKTDAQTLRDWAAFRTADAAASVLDSKLDTLRFEFRGRTLSGQQQQQQRWKRAVASVNGALGEAVGKLYVETYFPASSKAQMEGLTQNLKAAFRKRLEHNSWMSAPTRAAAIRKLDSFTIQVGYPKHWRDYDGLEIKADDLYGNAERAGAFEWRYWLGHLGKPVDRDVWDMTPQTVNAYNQPLFNEVVFPAAILQAPFFDPKADPAINYGAIGGVIGHEMTHGFDDEGRKFDARGQLRDWWTKEDGKRFDALAARLGAQFEAMQTPYDGMHINGGLTMGENIADLGGLTLALDAYHASLGGKPAPVVGGFTGDQRVFLGWAQVWREKLRDDTARQLLVTDPHSPPYARVNGPMHNTDAWYKAFDVKPGDKFYLKPEDRVRIW